MYALQSFVYTQAFVETNGVPKPVNVFEPDSGTVTVDEFEPFTYVVHEDTEVVTVGAAQSNDAVYLPSANSTVQVSTDGDTPSGPVATNTRRTCRPGPPRT